MNASSLASDGAPLDLEGYLDRIGHSGPLTPNAGTLAALHTAHVASIPFENLDVLWREPILLDVDSLQAKLVRRERGGYCFEHNGLFAAVLQRLGYSVQPLAARVRYRATRPLARTHMLLLVELGPTRYVADVGFGAYGLLAPLPLDSEEPSTQHGWRYRLKAESGVHVLQLESDGAWLDLYAFTLEPQTPADFVMANWYVSTHPHSRFARGVTLQLATPQARHSVQDSSYVVDHGGGDVREQTLGEADLVGLLASIFRLRLPEGVRLPLTANTEGTVAP